MCGVELLGLVLETGDPRSWRDITPGDGGEEKDRGSDLPGQESGARSSAGSGQEVTLAFESQVRNSSTMKIKRTC